MSAELKCFVDSVLKVMLFIEIKDGRMRMAKKDYSDMLRTTDSCVMWAVNAGKKFCVQQLVFVQGVHTWQQTKAEGPTF